MSDKVFDVIIVGAGAAGLRAATELTKEGKDVLILESRDRIGGRIYSAQTKKGTYVELGPQWLAETGAQKRFEAIIDKLEFTKIHNYPDGKLVSWDGECKKIDDPNGLPLTLWTAFQFAFDGLRLVSRADKIDLKFTPDMAEYDDMTVYEYYEREMIGKDSVDELTTALEGGFCRACEDISAYTQLYQAKLGGTSLKADEIYLDQGISKLFEKYASPFSDRIKLNSKVDQVDTSGAEVVVRSGDDKYTAKKVIMCMPPQLIPRVDFTPALPDHLNEVAETIVTGQVMKLLIVFPTPWWREKGFHGSINAYKDFSYTADLSHTNGNGVLGAFIVGPKAEEYCEKSDEELKELVREMLVASFDGMDEEIEEFFYHNWIRDEDSLGGFMSFVGKGKWKLLSDGFFPSVGNIHFAGTEYAHEWRGYIEGALESGERTARKVLTEIDPNYKPPKDNNCVLM